MKVVGWILAGAMLATGSAAHAIDYCAFPKVFTSKNISQVSSNIQAQLPPSCVKQTADSAYFESWKCDDVFVGLGMDEQKKGMTVFIHTPTPPDLDACGKGKDSPVTLIKKIYTFSSPSIWDVEAVVTEDFDGTWVFYAENDFRGSLVAMVEQTFLKQDTRYRSSDIQIAGVKLVGSTFEKLEKALISRGSTMLASDHSGETVSSYSYSPFVGLGGVTKIEASSYFSKILRVTYNIDSEKDYLVFVEQLDEKYGKSTPYTTKDGCRGRKWESNDAAVFGSYCSTGIKQILLFNISVLEDMKSIVNYLKENLTEPVKNKQIDGDNF